MMKMTEIALWHVAKSKLHLYIQRCGQTSKNGIIQQDPRVCVALRARIYGKYLPVTKRERHFDILH